uniref:Uncharacterized protein n=1 Tax=Amphimedon queenslandica TaxID=400682 RepID=A0A1X7T496_AMPQE
MPKTRQAGRHGCGSGRGASLDGAGPTLPSQGHGRPRRGVPLTRADLSPPVSAPVVQEPGPSSVALSEFLALIHQEVHQQLAAASPAGIQDQSGAPLAPADPFPSPLADQSSGSPVGVVGGFVCLYGARVVLPIVGHVLAIWSQSRKILLAKSIAALSCALPYYCFYLVASLLTTFFWEGVAIDVGEGWGHCFCDVARGVRVHSSLFPYRTPHSFENSAFRRFSGSSASSFGISAAANNNTFSSVNGSSSSIGDAPVI